MVGDQNELVPFTANMSRITQCKNERNLLYIFVAYTAEQFQTTDDLRVLHQIADAAARNAGVMAYWVGCSCMPDENQLSEDVRITRLKSD